MFVHSEGAGTPVLLLHAGASSGAQWAGYARALGPGVRTLAPDLHGHGNTPIPAEIHADDAIARLVDDLLVVLREVDRCHVVGHSFGGLVALALALRVPARIMSLTAIEPACFDALRVGGPQALYEQSRREVAQLGALMERGAFAQAMQIVLTRWGMGHWDLLTEPQRDGLVALAPALLGVGLQAALRWRFEPERLATLAGVPTLLVHGERSPAVALPVSETLRAAIPGARCVCIEGAGHMLPITHRPALRALLRGQLANRSATGPR